MKLVGVGEAQAGLSGLVDQSQKERIVLTRHGKPVALLVGIKGRDLEEVMLAQDPGFRALIAERRRHERPAVTHEALLAAAKREVGRTFFRERSERGDLGRALKALDAIGGDEKPRQGDEPGVRKRRK
ncbi:MAG: type II toxin-antitoxin system Phd/YefM family antitoxin [Micropepsaceae bacterium]